MASLPEHLMPFSVGRRSLPRKVMEAHQRERVLSAATEVFAKRGYQATTVDHLVAASRSSTGSFYSLFDGKEDCFLRAFDRTVDLARERILSALPDGSWPDQACAVLAALLHEIASEPLSARLVLVEAQTAGPAALGRYEATLQTAIDSLRGGRALAPLAVELPPTFEEATICGLFWLLHQRIVVGEILGIDVLLPELAQLVVAPFFGQKQAAHSLAAVQSASVATASDLFR